MSALCWAAFDVSRKRVGEELRATSAVAWLMFLHTPLMLPVLGLGEMTGGGASGGLVQDILLVGFPELTAAYGWRLLGTVSINVVANLMFLRAVQLSPLSLTTPYLSFTPVFTALLSMPFYGEFPTAWGWAGIAVVCLGAFFLNPGDQEHGPLAPLIALKTERGSLYMIAVSLMWSITPLIDKSGTELTSPLFHTWALSFAVAVVFFIYRVTRDGGVGELIEEGRQRQGWLVFGALTAVLAMMLQMASYTYAEIAYVETIKRAVGVLVAIGAGALLFGEGQLGRRVLAALVMIAGVAMLMLGG